MFIKFVKGPVAGMEPRVDAATPVLGELVGKRFNEYNGETEFGFRVKLERLLAEGLRQVRVTRVSKDLDAVEILE
jgi:hypothetical protein